MWKFIILALATTAGKSQVFTKQKCPMTFLTQHFQVDKYVGVWYEAQRFPAAFERNIECVTASYTKCSDGSIDVVNRGINLTTGKESVVNGRAVLIHTDRREARLYVRFPHAPFDKGPAPRGNYWILDTDYITYSLVYYCEQLGNMSVQLAWILSRKPLPEDRLIRKSLYAFKSFGIPTVYFKKVEQKNCNRTNTEHEDYKFPIEMEAATEAEYH
ncbi:apolipoprotein D-like [Artemia franciscana]|uniref:apolipoprotein D-like n=1 Tax=Artemia franciscana TaxID=6661 RepID=UPI0032DBCEC9